MSYSVGQVARFAGVTVRTLHHYEAIGLLAPGGRTASGYRRYDEDDLERLQTILFYRELGFSLDHIATVLSRPSDALEHLRSQHRLLLERIDRLEQMVVAVERAMEDKEMGTTPTPQQRFAAVTRGKVRDIYDVGDDQLLLVASDRISAFDVVATEQVPDKGRLLTAMTAFWLDALSDLAPNHLISTDPADFPAAAADVPGGLDAITGRGMLVRKAEMVPIECIVRGYLAGSAWREYRASGAVHGTPLPAGLLEASRLPEPMFTPSTKAETGHDENLTFEEARDLVGSDVAEEARRLSLAAYERGAGLAAERGIIIADTKFELGFIDGRLAICDEVLTPDSSRFWPAEGWVPGTTPPSLDKEPVRAYLQALPWDRTPPAPTLPPEIIAETRDRYVTAYERLTGRLFTDWPGVSAM